MLANKKFPLFFKESPYQDKDGNDRIATRFYLQVGNDLIRISIKFFGKDGNDPQYSVRKGLVKSFAMAMPDKEDGKPIVDMSTISPENQRLVGLLFRDESYVKDGEERRITNLWLEVLDDLVPIEVEYFGTAEKPDRSYAVRKAVLRSHATFLPPKKKDNVTDEENEDKPPLPF